MSNDIIFKKASKRVVRGGGICDDGHLVRLQVARPASILRWFFLVCSACWMLLAGAGLSCSAQAGNWVVSQPFQGVTNVSQFWTLTGLDYLRGCSFHLTGTVTLLNTNLDLLVLQDETGAVAVNMDIKAISVQVGQRISLESSNASPYVESFPEYPYRPSGWDIQPSLEAPSNWGDYHLTRMRGYLHPPVTGNYTFWIASDNSSELWLSSNEDPAKVRKIAFLVEGVWVGPRDWFHYPSQQSETIFLRADRTYYIEAIQEQITQNDHISAAWQGPGLSRAVIDGRYLTPWVENSDQMSFAKTNGILREYWTNYSAGSLVGVTGPRPYESVLSTKEVRLTVLGDGRMPQPKWVTVGQRLPPEDNFQWIETKGTVSFMAANENSATLEITDGQGHAQLRVAKWKEKWPQTIQNWRVQVQGVMSGPLIAGLIWVPTEQNISFIEPTITNTTPLSSSLSSLSTRATTNSGLKGFYSTRGVVTFNDKIFNTNHLFVQDDSGGGIFILPSEQNIENQLQVGQWVQIGGILSLDKYAPSLQPITIKPLGWRAMPEPVVGPADASAAKNENGLWTEIEGVIRSIDTNGVLTLAEKRGFASAWIGQVPTIALNQYVDSTLRMRGVMSLTTFDTPVLLVPSRDFVEVEQEGVKEPFGLSKRLIENLNAADTCAQWAHRVRIEGTVTYQDKWSFFMQDSSKGVRVQVGDSPSVRIGELVQVVGFPERNGLLTEALVRPMGIAVPLKPRSLELSEIWAAGHNGTLVRLQANLLREKTNGINQVLELQDGQHVFEALLANDQDKLQSLVAGSRLEITGICDLEPFSLSTVGAIGEDGSSSRTLQVWLRTSSDVVLLDGPPWWTWRRIAGLIGMLFLVLMGTLLWIYLLRRRLERQQTAQLTFSRQILQGQEHERRRIAANLHDGLGQNLLVIKNQARLAMQPVADESVRRQRLNEISGMASEALEEIRQITHDLRPYQLDRLGLTQTIRAAIRRVENNVIQFASDVEDIDGLLDKESEIHFYRIVQESLNNVIKHSGATEATVVVKKKPRAISFSMRDNGHGFDASVMNLESHCNAGFGLNGIKERVRILGAKLELDSWPAGGVNLTVEIPTSNFKNETSSEIADRR